MKKYLFPFNFYFFYKPLSLLSSLLTILILSPSFFFFFEFRKYEDGSRGGTESADVVAVAAEKPVTDKEVTAPAPVPEKGVDASDSAASEEKAVPEKEEKVTMDTETDKTAPVKEEETIIVFEKVIAPTPEKIEKKVLNEFKELVREALNKWEFSAPLPLAKEEKVDTKYILHVYGHNHVDTKAWTWLMLMY